MKGTVIISETLLEAVGIIISFILIVLVIQLVFQSQTQITYQSAFESVARDIATAIDRTAASSGSLYVQQDLPKGLKVNVSIDYKNVLINSGGITVRKSFSGLTNTPPVSFNGPATLCIIKTQNDNRVSIVSGSCQCVTNDNKCDPSCVAQGVCDSACINSTIGMCNPYCAVKNPGACDINCYSNSSTGICEKSCIRENTTDGICSPDCSNVTKGVCDIDCYNQYSNGNTGVCDPDCPAKGIVVQVGNLSVKTSDGKCYTGCLNYTKGNKIFLPSDGICDQDCNATTNICDPDCPDSIPCENICKKEGESVSEYPCCPSLIACPSTGICSKTCCGNGKCEGRDSWPPENKTLWETAYTCSQDCGTATRPSCSSSGSFVQSVCYRDIGTGTGDAPVWTGTAISVCDSQAQLFLDRRNWNIEEIFRTVKASPPEGWAFDYSRYNNACNRVQPAGLTISANENYTSSSPICCSTPDCPNADAPYLGSECAGVGYCADHAAGILSVLRTLGVPDKDVFMTFGIFGQTCGRHAFVVMKCDSSLPSNLLPSECQGHSNEWLRIDATQHFVALLKDTACVSMGVWWNDKGIYPQTYGKINNTAGYVYPQDATCSNSGQPTEDYCKNNFGIEHHFDLLCKPFNVQCCLPSGLCAGP